MHPETDSPLVGSAPRPIDPAVHAAFCRTAETLPPECAFSHTTAALLLGWPTPWLAQVTGDIHVMTRTGSSQIRRPGFVGHFGLESRRVMDVHGLRVVAPGDTWVDLGSLASLGNPYHFADLIACGDQALNYLWTREALGGIVHSRGFVRGKRNLIPALGYLRIGSESAPESQWRVIMYCAGLPSPLLNKNIYDELGTFLARPDYRWDARKVGGEYQGKQDHDTPQGVASDLKRFAEAQALGWQFIPVRSRHIHDSIHRRDKLIEFADALRFPSDRLDFDAAEPQRFCAPYLATLMENRERRQRRAMAQARAMR